MFEALFSRRQLSDIPDDAILFIDPSDQPVGSENILDHSKLKNTLTNYNNVTVSDEGPSLGIKSLYFDGALYRYLVIGWNGYTPNLLTGDFTIDFWFKPKAIVNGFGTLLGQWKQVENLGGFIVCTKGDSVQFHISPHSEVHALLETAGANSQGWHRQTVVRDGNVFTHYLDGVPVSTRTFAGTKGPIDIPMIIGGYINNSGAVAPTLGSPLNGWLTRLGVWQKAVHP